MTWFGEQIKNRIAQDKVQVSDALLQVADSISGKEKFHAQLSSTDIVRSEVERICNYYKLL